MAEIKLDILETKEVKAFDPVEWIREKIDKIKRVRG